MGITKAIPALTIAMTLCAIQVRAEGEHWSYGGHGGPAKWAELDHAFATCKIGKVQSPIDIRGASQQTCRQSSSTTSHRRSR